MANTFYTFEAANLFCGDHDPENSKHLTIKNLKLPSHEEAFEEHAPGGSRHKIKVGVGFEPFTATFQLSGFDPELLVQFGLGSPIRRAFTAYSEIKDRRTGRSIERKAVMEARLAKVEEDAFERGTLVGAEYMLDEILHYELHFDGKEKIYWDFFTNEWRVGGQNEYQRQNEILRIPRTGS